MFQVVCVFEVYPILINTIIFHLLCYHSHPIFSPLFPSTLHTHSHPHSPCLGSCPWVVHMNSLLSTFPILFLTSPCLFSTCHLCYLFPVLFPPLSSSHSASDNHLCDLHFCDSVPVLIVCLVCFCFWFLWGVQLLIVVNLLSFYCSYF